MIIIDDTDLTIPTYDQVVNAYLNLIKQRSNIAGFPKTKSLDVFFSTKSLEEGQPWNISGILENEILIIPHNIRNIHWTISVVYLKRKEIVYYDSYHEANLNILEKIFQALNSENLAAFGFELNRPEWKLDYAINTPLQTNGVDCGCHALIVAENISRRSLNFDFQTKEINSYREKWPLK